MSSVFTRLPIIRNNQVLMIFRLTSKDAYDDSLVSEFGDIIVNPSIIDIVDPDNVNFPKFSVSAGESVPIFKYGEVRALFNTSLLPVETLYKQATLWCDQIQLQVQTGLIALRSLKNVSTQQSMVTL